MKRIHIIGRKNHGKTTLCCSLLAGLRRRGLRAGCLKHSTHRHEIDTPGSDSHRLQQASGGPTVFWSGGRCGIYLPDLPETRLYERLAPFYADCDLVLCEGHAVVADAPCLEVWRAGLGDPPLATERPGIHALISDDPSACPVPRWPRCDLNGLIDRVIGLLDLTALAPGQPQAVQQSSEPPAPSRRDHADAMP